MTPLALARKAASAVARGARGLWATWGGSGVGSRFRFLLPGARFDYERESGDLWSNSIVATCVKWLGDNFPKPALRVSQVTRKGDHRPVGRHALSDLVARPNKHYTGRTLLKATGLSLVVDGNGYWYKVRSGSGKVVELWWLPHFAVWPAYPSDGSEYISHYDVLIGSTIYHIPPSEIVHFRDGIDPRNDRYGLAALKGQLREVCTVNEESGYTASLLRNSGVPAVAVVPKDANTKIDKDAADRIKERMQEEYTNDGRGGIAALSGHVELVKVGFSPEELRLDKLPARAEARITAAIGIDPMVVGLPSATKTYANLAEAQGAAWRNCLVPLQDLVAETLRWQLLPDFADPYTQVVEWDYSQVEALQENQKLKSERLRGEWVDGVITKNECREGLGYEPDPDGDVVYQDVTKSAPIVAPGPSAPPEGAGVKPGAKPVDPDPADEAERLDAEDAGDEDKSLRRAA